jgi:serine/threonine-protein kinase PRP4
MYHHEWMYASYIYIYDLLIDIKPDNMLLDEKQSTVKLCDFGSAFKITGNEVHDVTPYLVSRYYRAPEIILGLPYDYPVDIWSVGCCIFEMFTGKIAFPGQTNNEMLKYFMEVKGRIPPKLIRRHRTVYIEKFLMEPHFDEELRFCSREIDRVTGRYVSCRILFASTYTLNSSRKTHGAHTDQYECNKRFEYCFDAGQNAK